MVWSQQLLIQQVMLRFLLVKQRFDDNYNMISNRSNSCYCVTNWIYKQHCKLTSFDSKKIILLFTTMIVSITIIATTIIIVNIVIDIICINFPSYIHNHNQTQHPAMKIDHLNNNNQTLLIIPILIYINYIITIINSIIKKTIDKEITYKIQTFQWQHQLYQWTVFVASSIMLQHSNLWNHY